MSDNLAFAETIERVHKAVGLGSGFGGACRKAGWATLLIDGSPDKWVNVGSMFYGPSARAQRTKQALAEIGKLAGGAQMLWLGINDQSSG